VTCTARGHEANASQITWKRLMESLNNEKDEILNEAISEIATNSTSAKYDKDIDTKILKHWCTSPNPKTRRNVFFFFFFYPYTPIRSCSFTRLTFKILHVRVKTQNVSTHLKHTQVQDDIAESLLAALDRGNEESATWALSNLAWNVRLYFSFLLPLLVPNNLHKLNYRSTHKTELESTWEH